ncbi:hypothetical protein IJ818_07525 [bacterium]|nr:hypothetical protein [bacterium]
MEFFKYLCNPALSIIFLFFIGSVGYCVYKYQKINNQMVNLLNYLKKFKKSDLSFRFKEFDDGLSSNPYISNIWTEFRNTLVFDENVVLSNEKEDVVFENASQVVSGIQTTVDSAYFFNEEVLITSKLNYKFVQVTPTLLTGMGPLFTFMHIAFAFAHVDFTTNEATMLTIANLISNMQIAALCSVFAVGESLIFLMLERLLYNYKCKHPLAEIQDCFYKLFDSVTSEKFLIELLKTTKIQNNSLTNAMKTMPGNFQEALDKSLAAVMVPYLDNILFNLDRIKENSAKNYTQHAIDSVDDLFQG